MIAEYVVEATKEEIIKLHEYGYEVGMNVTFDLGRTQIEVYETFDVFEDDGVKILKLTYQDRLLENEDEHREKIEDDLFEGKPVKVIVKMQVEENLTVEELLNKEWN